MRRFAPLFSLALLLALPASAMAGGRLASATGVKQVRGETIYVDVVVAVPRSQSRRKATGAALADQGARRLKPSSAPATGFAYTGLRWSPPSVTQNYNPSGDPVGALTALRGTHSIWSNISGSAYRISYGGTTTRCPSLVQQCRGPQTTDGKNDVGWARLGGSTLAVTWYTISTPEADMAVSTRFAWSKTCGNVSGRYDVETVMLHENGHVAGLEHTSNTNSIMYPSYRSAHCSLYQYDKDAMANLY